MPIRDRVFVDFEGATKFSGLRDGERQISSLSRAVDRFDASKLDTESRRASTSLGRMTRGVGTLTTNVARLAGPLGRLVDVAIITSATAAAIGRLDETDLTLRNLAGTLNQFNSDSQTTVSTLQRIAEAANIDGTALGSALSGVTAAGLSGTIADLELFQAAAEGSRKSIDELSLAINSAARGDLSLLTGVARELGNVQFNRLVSEFQTGRRTIESEGGLLLQTLREIRDEDIANGRLQASTISLTEQLGSTLGNLAITARQSLSEFAESFGPLQTVLEGVNEVAQRLTLAIDTDPLSKLRLEQRKLNDDIENQDTLIGRLQKRVNDLTRASSLSLEQQRQNTRTDIQLIELAQKKEQDLLSQRAANQARLKNLSEAADQEFNKLLTSLQRQLTQTKSLDGQIFEVAQQLALLPGRSAQARVLIDLGKQIKLRESLKQNELEQLQISQQIESFARSSATTFEKIVADYRSNTDLIRDGILKLGPDFETAFGSFTELQNRAAESLSRSLERFIGPRLFEDGTEATTQAIKDRNARILQVVNEFGPEYSAVVKTLEADAKAQTARLNQTIANTLDTTGLQATLNRYTALRKNFFDENGQLLDGYAQKLAQFDTRFGEEFISRTLAGVNTDGTLAQQIEATKSALNDLAVAQSNINQTQITSAANEAINKLIVSLTGIPIEGQPSLLDKVKELQAARDAAIAANDSSLANTLGNQIQGLEEDRLRKLGASFDDYVGSIIRGEAQIADFFALKQQERVAIGLQASQSLIQGSAELARAFGSDAERMFRISQALSVTSSILSTAEGVAKSFALGGPGGYIAGIGLAGKLIGLIAQMKSLTLGDSSTNAPSLSAAPIEDLRPTVNANTVGTGGNNVINVYGNLLDSTAFRREVVNAVQEANGRDELNVEDFAVVRR